MAPLHSRLSTPTNINTVCGRGNTARQSKEMSKHSPRELNPNNSQVLGSSLPSEPPDIGNWFSTFVYESPELNNQDGFEDSGGPDCRRNCIAKVEKDKLSVNGKCAKVADRGSLLRLTESNGSEDSEAEVLESLESASLPPDLPGIRNWFSSYTYESPELNTLDGFKDCDGSRGNCNANANDSNLSDNSLNVKRNLDFVAGEKGSSYGFTEGNDYCGFGDFKSAAEVSGSSEELSFSSEPPGIENWFSSYVYETPLTNDTNFTVTDCGETEADGKAYVAQIRKSKIDKTRDSVEARKSSDLLNQRSIVKRNSLVKDEELDHRPISKDGHEAAEKQTLSVLNDSSSERIHQEISRPQRQQNHGDYCGKPDCQSLNAKINTENQDEKSIHKLIGRKNCSKISTQESMQPPCAPGEKISPNKLAENRNEQENIERNEFDENGFISTRKNRREVNRVMSTERAKRTNSETLRSGVAFSLDANVDSKVRRKVLCETTNFQHYPNDIESIGKWRCPQKRKPELGPPLKQLRLEKWIRPSQ